MSASHEQLQDIYYPCVPEFDLTLDYSDVNGFDLHAELDRLEGEPTVEIVGPTTDGFPIIDNRVPSEPIVTNIRPYETNVDAADMLADFKRMPLRSESVGMVLASCVPIYDITTADRSSYKEDRANVFAAYSEYADLGGEVTEDVVRKNNRIAVIEESARILKQDGLLVWQGGTPEDLEIARLNGLQIKRVGREESFVEYPNGNTEDITSFQCVFKKQ